MERNRLESRYNKYADKNAREHRLEEYDWERQEKSEQEWDDYNHNVSMYVDNFLH